MTKHKTLHPNNDIDRLYVSRKEGGRELTSIKDNVNASIQRLEDYILKRGLSLIAATRTNTRTSEIIIRKQKWEEKNSLDVLSD